MVPIDFDISDLPPPETVDGLWHRIPSAREATRRLPKGRLRTVGQLADLVADVVGCDKVLTHGLIVHEHEA